MITNILKTIAAGIIIGLCIVWITIPQPTVADEMAIPNNIVKTLKVVVTAYSSSWDETTGIPGVPGTVTASGKNVAPNIIANNMLPFGTKVLIPALYGNKVFIVGDRMAKYKSNYHIDLWMPSKKLALNFGVKKTEIEILDN